MAFRECFNCDEIWCTTHRKCYWKALQEEALDRAAKMQLEALAKGPQRDDERALPDGYKFCPKCGKILLDEEPSCFECGWGF
jgi:hypothetical protein